MSLQHLRSDISFWLYYSINGFNMHTVQCTCLICSNVWDWTLLRDDAALLIVQLVLSLATLPISTAYGGHPWYSTWSILYDLFSSEFFVSNQYHKCISSRNHLDPIYSTFGDLLCSSPLTDHHPGAESRPAWETFTPEQDSDYSPTHSQNQTLSRFRSN